MMLKTHLVIALFFLLIFIGHTQHYIIFPIVLLIAAVIPDLDTKHSKYGKHFIFRILQVFTRHRGFFHSFSFCLVLSVVLVFVFPIAALPFFMGYSTHILSDSFTLEGIEPFWPYKGKSSWIIRTNGKIEKIIFLCFAIVDVILLVLILTLI